MTRQSLLSRSNRSTCALRAGFCSTYGDLVLPRCSFLFLSLQQAHLLVRCHAAVAGSAVAAAQELGQGLDLRPEVDPLCIRRGEVRVQLLHLRLGGT